MVGERDRLCKIEQTPVISLNMHFQLLLLLLFWVSCQMGHFCLVSFEKVTFCVYQKAKYGVS